MSDEPVLPAFEETPFSSPSSFPKALRSLLPAILSPLATFVITIAFLHFVPSVIPNLSAQDVAFLRSQTTSLSQRLDHVEALERTPAFPSLDPEKIKEVEERIGALHERIETLQNQPKMETPPASLELPSSVREDIAHLAEAQQAFQSFIFLERLKAKALSGASYGEELADFKKVAKGHDNLAILEKYASTGLNPLQAAPEQPLAPSLEKVEASWRERFKSFARSLVKVERIEETSLLPSDPYAQDRKAVEAVLTTLDRALARQLLTLSSSSQPGDAS